MIKSKNRHIKRQLVFYVVIFNIYRHIKKATCLFIWLVDNIIIFEDLDAVMMLDISL